MEQENAEGETLSREEIQVLEVPEGILVIRDEKPSAAAPDPDRWWVIEDNPALSGTDLRNPEQNFDEARSRSSRSTSPIAAATRSRRSRARSRSAGWTTRSGPSTRAPPRSTSRSCSTTS